MLVKIINEETKEVSIGLEDFKEFYLQNGFKEMSDNDLEKAYNGIWYIKGYAPEKPLNEEKAQVRAQRDSFLEQTDKYMLSDFPINEEEKEKYRTYRQYLRDIPQEESFPDIHVQTFEEWRMETGNKDENSEEKSEKTLFHSNENILTEEEILL